MLGLDMIHRALLQMEPEAAHDAAIRALRWCQLARLPLAVMRRRCAFEDPRLGQEIWGNRFSNPVGLAAGFDKNGVVIRGMAALGFGFLEIGTVTPMPQRGNPRPRVFRHREQRSLQNALGFNNAGAESIRRNLRAQHPFPVPVGINVGKNRATIPAQTARDYEILVEGLTDLADYLVLNISSPNTPGLRDLQRQSTTVDLVRRCRDRTDKPVLVKLSPDLDDDEAVSLAHAVTEAGAAGIVVTNTTIDYSLLPGVEPRGGLSGRVLRHRSLEMLRLLARRLEGRCRLISVGGIESAEDTYGRIRNGASLVQIYTALVYEGPLLIHRILQGLARLLERDGIDQIGDAIGVDVE